MENMTVCPRHVTLPNNENESKGITWMESVEKPFKVNISPTLDIREIGLIASGQENNKAKKYSLKGKLIFNQMPTNPATDKEAHYITPDEPT